MLISHILPIMAIYRLPYGPHGYRGHILNVPQDVTSFINNLPRSPSTLDVIIVRKEGAVESHKDFRVRRSVVLRVLQWLVVNNNYYHDVTINHDVLALLPTDEDLTDLLTTTVFSDEVEVPPQQDNADPYSTHFGSTFVPLATTHQSEQQTIHQSIMVPPCVNWPSTVANPVNEFTTEGYISCVFPTLSNRSSRFLAPRQHSVTIGNYFKHLMLYCDQRLAKHPRFRYFTLNTQIRHRALQMGRIYVRQNPHDGHLSVDELREMVGQDNDTFSSRVGKIMIHFQAGYFLLITTKVLLFLMASYMQSLFQSSLGHALATNYSCASSCIY